MQRSHLLTFGIVSVFAAAIIAECADRMIYSILLAGYGPTYDDSGPMQLALLLWCALGPVLAAMLAAASVLLVGLLLWRGLVQPKAVVKTALCVAAAGWALSLAWSTMQLFLLNRFWP
jgi:hypothetical protein